MELKLQRSFRSKECTIGILSVDGKFECFICEDYDRGLSQGDTLEVIKKIKVPGKTAIPTGRYEIAVTFSNRFQKPLPLLLNVPGFEGIRIHPGNTAADTEGCLLPGTDHNQNSVSNSRAAFYELFEKIKAANEKVFIDIV